MNEEGLHVKSLDIVRAPGFQSRGFHVDDLTDGINVVYGPNASGKTTMALSIQELLWPGEVRDDTELVGQLSLNGDDWLIDARSGRASYQRNGQNANGPGLPPADERDRYHLCLHDLLRVETRNESFAATIERESAGGYDLSTAAERLGFSATPSSRRIGEVSEAESALDAWHEARSEMEALRSDEQTLGRLQNELADAKDAKERVELLEQAVEFSKATSKLEAVDRELSEFPDILQSIEGDEAETVDELRRESETWEETRENAQEDLEKATESLEKANLPDEGIPEGVLDRVKSLANTLDGYERDRESTAAALEEARSKRKNCLEEIPLDVDEEILEDLNPVSWGVISDFVRDANQVRLERAQYESAQRWLSEREQPEQDLPTLQNGQTALENWLKTSGLESTEGVSAPLIIGMTSALLLGIAGVTLGYLVHPGLFLFVAAGAGLGAYGYTATVSGTDGAEAGRIYRSEYEELELDPPESWKIDAVKRRLTVINNNIASHELGRLVEERRDALEGDLEELEHREESLREQRADLRERFRLDIDVSDLELLVFAKGVLRWQTSNDDVVGLESKIDKIDAQIDESCDQLEEALAPYWYTTVENAAEAMQHITDLESRITQHTDATRDLDTATATIERATEKLDELEAERDEIFTEIGLEPDDSEQLRALCNQVDEYLEVKDRVHKKRVIVNREAEKLEAYPDFDPDLTTKQLPELERDKRRAEERAESYDDIHEEITEIQTKVDEAKADSEVEDAISEKRRALDSLYGKLDEDCTAMVGDVLTSHVRDETGETDRPAVFEYAREVLARITHGRYRLDLDEEGDGTFRAFDTTREMGFDLDELSSATRLQVLLAVRIAFVEHQEQGEKLPLILDETLANTDDRKAEVVIESMIELAKGGRQVFYFTAQGDEVGKWRAALEDTVDVDHREIDLTDVQDHEEEIDVPDFGDFNVRPSSPPRPDSHDYESYGEALGVKPFNPRLGAGSAHLWYVVDDVTLLYQLLNQGIERWGQLENLVTRVGRKPVVDEPNRLKSVEQNGHALEEFVRTWETGRGAQVDRQVLEESGAVSETFIDRVTELAEVYNGEGSRVIEALRNSEVDRFRSGKTDELETYFEENGFIESIEPLEPEAIRLRVVNSFVKAGVDREVANEEADALLNRLDTA